MWLTGWFLVDFWYISSSITEIHWIHTPCNNIWGWAGGMRINESVAPSSRYSELRVPLGTVNRWLFYECWMLLDNAGYERIVKREMCEKDAQLNVNALNVIILARLIFFFFSNATADSIAPYLERERSQLSQLLPQQPNHMVKGEFQRSHTNLHPMTLPELKQMPIINQKPGMWPQTTSTDLIS